MSRRHHGRPSRSAPGGPDGPWRGTGVESRPSSAPESLLPRAAAAPPAIGTAAPRLPEPAAPIRLAEPAAADRLTPAAIEPGDPPAPVAIPSPEVRVAQCTAPQLRRFIKSRPYVPLHELRRRFNIEGGDDDVTPVRIEPGWIYVGLPSHEGRLLGDLLRTGEIGYELSLDPRTPIVIGVYPMRPIARN
jgi:hypothetical protein